MVLQFSNHLLTTFFYDYQRDTHRAKRRFCTNTNETKRFVINSIPALTLLSNPGSSFRTPPEPLPTIIIIRLSSLANAVHRKKHISTTTTHFFFSSFTLCFPAVSLGITTQPYWPFFIRHLSQNKFFPSLPLFRLSFQLFFTPVPPSHSSTHPYQRFFQFFIYTFDPFHTSRKTTRSSSYSVYSQVRLRLLFQNFTILLFFIRSPSISARAGLQNRTEAISFGLFSQIKSFPSLFAIYFRFLFFPILIISIPYAALAVTFLVLYIHLPTHFRLSKAQPAHLVSAIFSY